VHAYGCVILINIVCLLSSNQQGQSTEGKLIQHWRQPGKITHYTHSFPSTLPDFTDTGHWSLYDGSLTPAHTVILSTLRQQQQQQLLLLHPFSGLFSRTTWVSCYQKGKTSLDLTEARDDGGRWPPLASRPPSACSVCCGSYHQWAVSAAGSLSDPVYQVNSCSTQTFEWRTKTTLSVTIFLWGCTEFPEFSMFREIPENCRFVATL